MLLPLFKQLCNNQNKIPPNKKIDLMYCKISVKISEAKLTLYKKVLRGFLKYRDCILAPTSHKVLD